MSAAWRGDPVERVDFCVTTFMRPEPLEQLLTSIAGRYPRAAIYVADQGRDFDVERYDQLWRRLASAGLVRRPTVERLQFDCGVSVARNWLVTSTPREYKLILDDDFVFTADTRVERFVALLDACPNAGVVGGRVTRDGAPARFDFRIEVDGRTLREVPDDGPLLDHAGVRYRETECVVNFALMRRELFDLVMWDPALKLVEHEDFYLRLRPLPYTVLHTPDVTVEHPHPDLDSEYAAYRARAEFVVASMVKHGLTRVETINGLVVELGSDALTIRPPNGIEIVHPR